MSKTRLSTSDFCKHVFFGDLLLHLLSELLFSFCTRTVRVVQTHFPSFCTARETVLEQKLNTNKCKSNSPKKTRLQKSAFVKFSSLLTLL